MKVGIVSLGELGLQIALNAQANGWDVVTTTEGRSKRTREVCARSGIKRTETLVELVETVDVLVSAVPPRYTMELGRRVAGIVSRSTNPLPLNLFVDCNSVGPSEILGLGEELGASGIRCVDVAVVGAVEMGPATYYVAGAVDDDPCTELLGTRVVRMGAHIGDASALKMALSFVTKGAFGGYLHGIDLARAYGVLAEWRGAVESLDGLGPWLQAQNGRADNRYERWGPELRCAAAAAPTPSGRTYALSVAEVFDMHGGVK